MSTNKINTFAGIIMFFGIMLFSLFGVEVVMTKLMVSKAKGTKFVRTPIAEDSTGTVFRFRPNDTLSYGGIDRKTNNLGFLSKKKTTQHPGENIYRIIIYGDSVTYGVFLKEKDTYPYILEKVLNSSTEGKQFEVLNAGLGNSPFQYAMHIQHDIEQFKPDMIIFQIEVLNDTADDMMYAVAEWDPNGLPKSWTGGRYKLSLVDNENLFLSNIGWGSWSPPSEEYQFLNKFGSLLQRTMLYTYASRFA